LKKGTPPSKEDPERRPKDPKGLKSGRSMRQLPLPRQGLQKGKGSTARGGHFPEEGKTFGKGQRGRGRGERQLKRGHEELSTPR